MSKKRGNSRERQGEGAAVGADKNDEPNLEEGEVPQEAHQIYDENNYVIADKLFECTWQKRSVVNWGQIASLNFENESGLLADEDPTRDILQNMDAIAHADLNADKQTRWISNEGKSAMKVMQCGM